MIATTPGAAAGTERADDDSGLFAEHIAEISGMAEKALAVCEEIALPDSHGEFGGIVFHAGATFRYHADDQTIPFRSLPHFARFAPLPGPDHLLVFRPGEPVRVGRVVPSDYWEDAPRLPDHPFTDVLDVLEGPSLEAVALLLGDLSDCAYIGVSSDVALRLGISLAAVEPRSLLAPLDWYRGFKTGYEVECIRRATRRAARGHAAIRAGFLEGRSERELHAAYLEASGQLDGETPYPNIIAWDDRASVLHFQRKRVESPQPGLSLLVDAGASAHGYACDVSRTYVRQGVHDVFRCILDQMEELQQELVDLIRPGRSYVELHERAVQGVAAILSELGILRVSADEARRSGIVSRFLPHGVGHHLGLQVHDVGGQQVTREGEMRSPPEEYPTLRTTRELDTGHVVTVEPGLYFIPLLLDSLRDSDALDWKLLDELIPCGGVRIEDDVLVTRSGRENLTRPLIPGHRDCAP